MGVVFCAKITLAQAGESRRNVVNRIFNTPARSMLWVSEINDRHAMLDHLNRKAFIGLVDAFDTAISSLPMREVSSTNFAFN
jgi:hypothetical protein